MTKNKNPGKLLLLTGLPASGKDTIVNLFLKRNPDFKFVVSYTDRPMRKGEIQGVHHHFVTTQYFQSLIRSNKLLEHVKTGLYYKGTPKNEFNKLLSGNNTAWRVELTRFANFEDTITDNFDNFVSKTIIQSTTKIILMPENKDIAFKRYSSRDNQSEIADFEKRWDFEWTYFQKNLSKFPYVVKNYTGKKRLAVENIEKILGLT